MDVEPAARIRPGRLFAVAVAALVLLGLGLWWVASQAPSRARPDGAFTVFVVGPQALLHNGTVVVDDADALSVLQELAVSRGFEVLVDDLDGCAYDYVRGVAGFDETATGGWNYYVRHDGDPTWRWQDHAASCGGLRGGDDVLWCWVEPDERCAVYP